jgi:hypothetical protein
MWESVTKSPFSSFTILALGWYPFLKSVMLLYISDSFELTVIFKFSFGLTVIFKISLEITVTFKFLKFRFQIFLLLVPEMCTILSSYIV